MAQQLRAEGHEVALLAVFCPGRLTSFEALLRRVRQRIDLEVAALSGLPPRRKLTYLLAKARRVGTRMAASFARTHDRAHPLDHAMRGVEEAHLRALRAYVPRPYSGQVTVFLTRK